MKEQAYFAAIPIKVLQDNSIYHSYRILYGQIASYANTSGCCWATNETLGKAIDLSESSVSRGIKELAIRGHIKAYIDKETGNKRRIYPQQSSDIPDDEKGNYTLLYQERPTPPIRTHADRGSAPTPTPIRTHADIIEINKEDKQECTGDSKVSIFFESIAPRVNANPEKENDSPRHIKEINICSNGLKEDAYKQALMGLIKKFAKEYWNHPGIGTFLDYCWENGKPFEVKTYKMKKYVPGLLELLKAHFEGEIGEMNKKKADIEADHSEIEDLVEKTINWCNENWNDQWRTYPALMAIRKSYDKERAAIKKLLVRNKKREVSLIMYAYSREPTVMNQRMDSDWASVAGNFKNVLELAEALYNERKSWVIPGWPKQQS